MSPAAGARLGALLFPALIVAAVLPMRGAGQTGVIVQGQVHDAGSGDGLANAVVTLVGHGTTLSTPSGYFRFERVDPVAYTLMVEAFGYASQSLTLVVEGDTTLSVPLEIAPLLLDSLVVAPRLIDLDGRVRDRTRDLNLVEAYVLPNRADATWTDSHGRFTLEDLLAEVPLRVLVRAFGYLQLDTTFVPVEEASYVFELEPDTVIERLVAIQVERIEERASPRRAILMRPMNRERLITHAGGRTLADMLEWEYGASRLEWVECVVIDEKQLLGAWKPSSLFHILPEQLERVEFLGLGNGRRNGSMLRIYTREFMRQMISRDVELRTPTLFGWSDHETVPAVCQ